MTYLHITLLGPAAITLDNTAVSSIKTTKAFALLAYLALEADRPHRREALAGLLWPEFSDNAARSSLRQALANLRSALENPRQGEPPLFLASRESLQINPEASFNLDVSAFDQHLTFTRTHPHRRLETCAICTARLSLAAALYRGDLLKGISLADAPEFENWLSIRREALHRQALQTLAILANTALRTAGYENALQFAKRQLELEPWRESAHRQAMRAYAYSGQRAAALAQFELARQVLADELGVGLEDETAELYYRIRDNALGPGPADRRIYGTIPEPTTSLIGRESEIIEISRLIADPDCRLLTLTGPGGIGKTRLARELALSLESSFPNGAAFVLLASASDHDDIVAAITDTIGLRLQSDTPEEEQVLNFLEEKELLLVLDNYEQLLPETGFLERLLDRAPGIVPLITSRHRLGLMAEWVFELRGLFVPPSLHAPDRHTYSSIQLFVDRARRVDSQFKLTAENEQAITFICRLTGGLPLAIELASALVRYESPGQIAGHLQEGLDSLSTTHRDHDPRHRSITAAFEHSWRLLTDYEKQLFSRLSVFSGGFTPGIALEVTGGSRTDLFALIDKSLVMRKNHNRLGLHELLRQFAAEKLTAAGEEHTTSQKHLHSYARLAKEGEKALYGSPEQLAWLKRLDQENANMRAALQWGLENDPQAAAELAAANWLYYFMHGHFYESKQLYETLLQLADQLSPSTTAWLINARCSVALAMGNLDTLQAYGEKALALFQTLEDQLGTALSYHHLATTAIHRGQLDEGQRLTKLGLQAGQDLPWVKAVMLHHLELLNELQGDLDRTSEISRQRLAISEQINDGWGTLYAVASLIQAEIKRGNVKEAKTLLAKLQPEAEKYQEQQILSWIHVLQGQVALAAGDPQQAVAKIQQSIEIPEMFGSGQERISATWKLGVAQTESGRFKRAREVLIAGAEAALNEHRFQDILNFLENFARLDWIELRDPSSVRNLSAVAAKREALQLPAEFPFDALVEKTLKEMRGEIAPDVFEAFWQNGRDYDPAELLQELIESKKKSSLTAPGSTPLSRGDTHLFSCSKPD